MKVKRESSRNEAKKYIIVGGDVLARGLTVWRLMVSYFLRHSSTYDINADGALVRLGSDMKTYQVWMTEEMQTNLRTLQQWSRNSQWHWISCIKRRCYTDAICSENKNTSFTRNYFRNRCDGGVLQFSSHHKQTFKFYNDLNWLKPKLWLEKISSQVFVIRELILKLLIIVFLL